MSKIHLFLNVFASVWVTSSIVGVVGIGNACAQKAQNKNVQPEFQIPDQVLAGSPLAIKLSGFLPNSKVKIEAKRVWGWTKPRLHQSVVHVTTDTNGAIDLSKQAPIAESESSYQGIHPLGLLWAMKPVSDEVVSPHAKDVVVFRATQLSADNVDEPVAEASLEIINRDADVQEFPLSDDPKLEGAFVMMLPSKKPRPVIITLGGSEGGDSSARRTAPILASMGYAVVGYPYYSPAYNGDKPQFPSLPQAFADIPLDRIELVLDEIERHPNLDINRVGLHGVSKGGEFVLAVASRIDRFKAVVAIVPSDVIWEGWGAGSGPTSSFSFREESLPFVPYKGMGEAIAKMQRGEKANIRIPHDAGRAAFPDRVEPARIQVENIHAAVMVVGGEKDELWDSGGMCRNIVKTRKNAGLETEAWISPKAGHYLSGHAYNPTKYRAEAALRTESFPAMVEFFAKNLNPKQ